MTKDTHLSDSQFYGRRKGRPLTKERLETLEALLPLLRVDEALLTQDGGLDPLSLFGRHQAAHKVIFEIGFGQGERLAEHMRREPDTLFLGAEPFINGMAGFLKAVQGGAHDHVRVLMEDAMLLARSLRDASLDEIYVLNPDPWHKTRHHKRRIIHSGNLDVFARILKPGGRLVMSTDVPPLAEWMVTQASLHSSFSWTARRADDWRCAPEGWITTRYETKGAKGAKRMSYLIFERV